MIAARQNPVLLEEDVDAGEIAEARFRRNSFDRNWAWFQLHAVAVYRKHRGKIICVTGEQLFVGDTTAEALALADAVHPDDEGRFTLIIPQEPMVRIYVAQG